MSEEENNEDFLSKGNLTNLIKDGIIFSIVGIGVKKVKDSLEDFIEGEEDD